MKWKNRPTLEAFREAVHTSADELEDILREWRQLEGEDFITAYAEQLKEDFHACHRFDRADPESRLYALGMQVVLSRVDWRQVAERLVEYARQGPWPPHLPIRCWCSRPVSCWGAADIPLVAKGNKR